MIWPCLQEGSWRLRFGEWVGDCASSSAALAPTVAVATAADNRLPHEPKRWLARSLAESAGGGLTPLLAHGPGIHAGRTEPNNGLSSNPGRAPRRPATRLH